jgi:hypothetical protein
VSNLEKSEKDSPSSTASDVEAYVPPRPLMSQGEREWRQQAVVEKKLSLMDDLLDLTQATAKHGKKVLENVETAAQLRDFSAAVKNISDVLSQKSPEVEINFGKDAMKQGGTSGVMVNISFDKPAVDGLEAIDIDYEEIKKQKEAEVDDGKVRFSS